MTNERIFVGVIALAFHAICGASMAFAEPVRVAMPSKSLTFLNYYAALQGGGAAAALLSIPFNFKAEESGYRSLGNVADYLRTVLGGLGTSDARIKSNAAQVKRVIRATLRGMDFARDPAHQDKVTAFIMEDFQVDRKTAEASLREIVKNYSKDGTTADEAVRGDIDFIREQNKIKAAVPLGQVLNYGILKEALSEMKR